MITIVYPPGCYGHYIVKCLYYYTDLKNSNDEIFKFNENGSSHDIRENKNLNDKIKYIHEDQLNGISLVKGKTIAILPNQKHNLDYFNNYYSKQTNNQLLEYLTNIFFIDGIDAIDEKIKTGWGWTGKFGDSTPKWIMREFLSFWIYHYWENGYNLETYYDVSDIRIDTQDIFLNFTDTFSRMVSRLNLNIDVTLGEIIANHDSFVSKQIYHNSQLNCDEFVEMAVNTDKNVKSPCQTILDEAYVQFSLRKRGIEIKCYDLNNFVRDSESLRAIFE